MKKSILKYTCLIMALSVLLLGCSSKKTTEEPKYFKNMPSKFEVGECVVCTNKLNIVIDKNLTLVRHFSFWILSDNELSSDDVTIMFDNVSAPYNVVLSQSEYFDKKFSKHVLLTYNDFDWKYFNELKQSSKKEDRDKYYDITNEIDSEYEKIAEDKFAKFYITKCNVSFKLDDITKDTEDVINSMTVIVNGNEYPVDLGDLFIKYNSYIDINSYDSEINLDLKSGGRYDVNFAGEKNNQVYIPQYDAVTKKEITIKDIRLVYADENKYIDSVNFIISGNDKINQQWTSGDEIFIPADSNVTIIPIVVDDNLGKYLHYATNVYFKIVYEVDGKLYSINNQVIGSTRYSADELYASFKDNIDMMKYYSVYNYNY